MGLFGFLFGDNRRERAQRNQWAPSVIGKNLISPVNTYGTCFACNGSGSRTLTCNACQGTGKHAAKCHRCQGTGVFERPAQLCFRCSGTGLIDGKSCAKCLGSGHFKAPLTEACRSCNGNGSQANDCRRCQGAGNFTVTCKKCDGSGWFKFKK